MNAKLLVVVVNLRNFPFQAGDRLYELMRRFSQRVRQTVRDYNFNTVDSKLDVLSLSLSGMRDGVGPVLTLYLVSQLGLAPVELSWVVAAAGFATLCTQTPIGILYDRVHSKSRLLALGAILMAVACYSMSLSRAVPILIALQLVIGVASCLLSIGIPAVCINYVRNETLPSRFARNEIFAKVGNFSALALTGLLMQKISLSWVFYIVPILAAPVVWSALRLPAETSPVSPAATLGKAVRPSLLEILSTLVSSKRFLFLMVLAAIYELANASLFFVYEQEFMKSAVANRISIISTSLIMTQVVITCGFLLLSQLKNFSAYQIFTFGFLITGLRGLAFALDLGLPSLVIGQIFDGLIAAILFTQPIRILAEISRTNFNVMSGLIGTCVSLGATVSTLLAGYAIQHYGTQTTFIGFALLGSFGFVCAISARHAFVIPQSKVEKSNRVMATQPVAV